MSGTKSHQNQPADPIGLDDRRRPARSMKKELRMEARSPDPDDLTSEEPAEPSAIQARSGVVPPKDVSAPHIPPVED